MTIEMARFLKEASENSGNEASLREGYLGRGMGNQETVGVVVESEVQLLADVIQYVSEQIGERTYEDCNEQERTIETWNGPKIPAVSSFRIDNMGHGVILY